MAISEFIFERDKGKKPIKIVTFSTLVLTGFGIFKGGPPPRLPLSTLGTNWFQKIKRGPPPKLPLSTLVLSGLIKFKIGTTTVLSGIYVVY